MYSTSTKCLLKQAGIDIHSRHWTSPISLRVICSYLELKYRKLKLSPNTCGMLMRSNEGNYVYINEEHHPTRRRFSLAHEIGHFILNHESGVSTLGDKNRREEVQANRYASSLLMPDELFHYVHKENPTINAMADWLRVSPISVAIRCQMFGLREYESELVKQEYYLNVREVAASKEKPAEKKPEIPNFHRIVQSNAERNEEALERQWRKFYDSE